MNQNINNITFKTVKTTVGAILIKDKKILLTKRNVLPEKGKWCVPGGHVDIGETAITAVKREIKEETGLTIKKPIFFKYFDEYMPKLKSHAIVLIFYDKPIGKENANGKEVIEQKWFSEEEIKKLNLAFHHRKILNEFFKEIK